MPGQEKPTGFLTIKLIEALGTTKDDSPLWEDSFTQGFVKGDKMQHSALTESALSSSHNSYAAAVELRGPTRHVKVSRLSSSAAAQQQAIPA